MEVAEVVREFLVQELPFLKGAGEISDDMPLKTGGLLDSIGQIKLICLLEQTFDVAIDSADIEAGHIGTIATIHAFVHARIGV